MSNVQRLHLFELAQELSRVYAVVAVTLQRGDNLSLPHYVPIGLSNMLLNLRQKFAQHLSIHRAILVLPSPRIHPGIYRSLTRARIKQKWSECRRARRLVT
jgi:hypothetical protein